MSRVLVTGANGFIGSHLTELLVARGYDVKALSEYNSFNHWGWLEDIDCIDQVDVVTGDIRDLNSCRQMMKDVDVVFHLAALIAIPYSYTTPESYVDTNIKGTLNICQAALDNGIKRLIHTSTSEVYGTAEYVPIDELHPLKPQSPYSATKIGADAIAMSFYTSFDLPVSIARPFNTYGPRQSARAFIPSVIIQIADEKKCIRLGNVSPTRDFLFVKETCRGFLEIAESERTIGEIINIGTNIEVSLENTISIIKDIMNSNIEVEIDSQRIRPERSEVYRLWCDDRKIRELVGFQSKIGLEEGLTRTVDWFRIKENLSKYKSDIYNV